MKKVMVAALMGVLFMTSCSKEDNSLDAYRQWQLEGKEFKESLIGTKWQQINSQWGEEGTKNYHISRYTIEFVDSITANEYRFFISNGDTTMNEVLDTQWSWSVSYKIGEDEVTTLKLKEMDGYKSCKYTFGKFLDRFYNSGVSYYKQ